MTPSDPDNQQSDDDGPDLDEGRHRHDVITELTIARAHAQMLLRRFRQSGQVGQVEASERLTAIVTAIDRITGHHR